MSRDFVNFFWSIITLFILNTFYWSMFEFSNSFLCCLHSDLRPFSELLLIEVIVFLSSKIKRFDVNFSFFICSVNISSCLMEHFYNSSFTFFVIKLLNICFILALAYIDFFPLWIDIFLVLYMLSNFGFYPGHFEYVMRIWVF